MKKIVFLLFFICFMISYSYVELGKNIYTSDYNLYNPIGIDRDIKGNYYILDYVLGKIVKFDKNFKVIDVYKGFKNPVFFNIIDNNIYVTESDNNIKIFNLKNREITDFGRFGMQQLEFYHPYQILEYKNEIYIVDEYNFRIQILNKNNEFLREILLPRFNYIYKPFYENNYSILFKKNILFVLDSFNKSIYEIKEGVIKKTVELKFIERPIKLFEKNSKIMILDIENKNIYDYDTYEKEELKMEIDLKFIKFNQLFVDKDSIYFFENKKLLEYKFKSKKLLEKFEFEKNDIGKYLEPVDVKLDSKNNIYVLDKKLSKIIIYDNEGKYKKEIKDVGENPTSIFIDDSDNIYIAVAGENAIRKYDRFHKLIYKFGTYEDFLSNSYYDYKNKKVEAENDVNIEFNKNINLVDKHIYNMKLSLDDLGFIFVLDSKDMKIKKFDQFFIKSGEFGDKVDVISIFRNKKGEGKFGWDEYNKDNLSDFFIYKDKKYILDKYYGKINVFSNMEFEKSFEDNFSKDGLNGIYIKDDEIYIVDSYNFRICIYDLEFNKVKEYSFIGEGIIPIKIFSNYVIVLIQNSNYMNEYKILDLREILNDRDKKSEKSI